MEVSFALIHVLFLIFSPFLPSLTATTNPENTLGRKPHRLAIKLIHRNSVHHPEGTFAANDAKATLLPIGAAFLASFSIGQPPIQQLSVIDTGSNLLWVQCIPCTRCFRQQSPMFDPSKSSTYYSFPCGSPEYVEDRDCDTFDNISTYSIEYADSTSTSGVLASEQLVLETIDEGLMVVPNVTFGCGHNNRFDNAGQVTGVIGLGAEPESLARQLGNRFSYCIGSITDPHYQYNQLILGEESDIEGDSTPFQSFNGKYYVSLVGISVGEERLDIEPGVFKRAPNGKGGVIVDTGSTITYLEDAGFNILSDKVQNLTNGLLTRVVLTEKPRVLCYEGSVNRDLVGFPVVTFHFAWGAELVLDYRSLFYQYWADTFCMAVNPRDGFGNSYSVSIIGILAQQNYNVGYDLEGKTISFQRIDCELLND